MATGDPAFLLAHLLFAYVVLGEPWLSILFYRRLQAQIAVEGNARARYYRLLLVWEWSWAAVLTLILLGTGASVGVLGIRTVSEMGWLVIWGIAAAQVIVAVLLRFLPPMRRRIEQQIAGASGLLPKNTTERWLYAAVALTAGICEELLYRGFAWFYLATVFPVLPTWAVGVISSLLFGVAHAYQGRTGVLQASLGGGAFFALYWLTGSLVPSIVAHVLADLRILALPAPSQGERIPRAAARNGLVVG